MQPIHLEGLSQGETIIVLCVAFACLGSILTVIIQVAGKKLSEASTADSDTIGTAPDLLGLGPAVDAHAMINIADLQGKLVYVNDAFVATTGYARDEVLGHEMEDFLLAPGSFDTSEIRRRLADGENWTGRSKLIRKDGTPIWTSTTIVPMTGRSGKITLTVSLRTNITEQQQEFAEEHSRNLLKGLRDEVYVFAVEDLKLCYLNRQAQEFLGWSEADVVGKTLRETASDFYEAPFRERITPLLSGETDVVTYESTHQGRPVEVNLQVIDSPDGKTRLVGVLRDITRRKKAEADRAAFVANVSHELRSPLTSVMGALKLGTAGALGPLPDKAQSVLGVALRNVERLVLLINDLLDLEKIESGTIDMPREPINLSEVVKEAVAANANYAAELGVSIATIGTACPHVIDANPRRIIQVLNNLLSNASKFSTAGQTVEVEVRDTPKSVQVFVRDHGIGIPADMQSKMFDRFAQVSTSDGNRPKGTGLGLSIAKAIVEEHGGAIHLTSTEGVGTTFCIELPRQRQVRDAA